VNVKKKPDFVLRNPPRQKGGRIPAQENRAAIGGTREKKENRPSSGGRNTKGPARDVLDRDSVKEVGRVSRD